jgi:FtsH-binding integral membrane protein
MSVVRDFFATLYKMFAADLVMTALALATVAVCAAASGAIGATALPYVLLSGVVLALIVAVARGIKR